MSVSFDFTLFFHRRHPTLIFTTPLSVWSGLVRLVLIFFRLAPLSDFFASLRFRLLYFYSFCFTH
jgi:hypothetical protein